MEVTTVPELFWLITSFLSIFFALFLLTLKSKRSLPNILIGLFLIVFAIDTGGTVFFTRLLYINYPGIGFFFNSLIFLELPLLFLYILSVVYNDFKLEWKHLIHAVPFILVTFLLFPNFYLKTLEEKYAIISTAQSTILELKIAYVILHVQILFYIIISFNLVNKYRRLLLQNYSNAKMMNHRWLFQLLGFIAFDFVISTLKNTTLFLQNDAIYDVVSVVMSILALIMITWIVFKALRFPELFKGVDSKNQLTRNKKDPETQLSSSESKALNSLKEIMKLEEPFLNPSLSISDLAEQIDISTKELSQLINHKLHKHFFDFVNEYRINKAKAIFENPKDDKVTILEVLYEVGFNSKSSFNTAFKKHTGLTPSQYRNKVK